MRKHFFINIVRCVINLTNIYFLAIKYNILNKKVYATKIQKKQHKINKNNRLNRKYSNKDT